MVVSFPGPKSTAHAIELRNLDATNRRPRFSDLRVAAIEVRVLSSSALAAHVAMAARFAG
jgi:hypothetical protein